MAEQLQFEEHKGLNFTETVLHIPFGDGKTLKLATGKLAKQAAGAVIATLGDTTVLVACVMSDKESPLDFFPLLVDFREKFYAGGRIPGGFFKREARPSDGETLQARLIDRTIRPLFPEGFKREVQVYVTVLSTDGEHQQDLVAMCAAGAALHISEIPMIKPIAGVRMGLVDGKLVLNPTRSELAPSALDLVVAGHRDAINMVECGAKEVSEDTLVEALEAAHAQIKTVCDAIDKLRERVGKPKIEFTAPARDEALYKRVERLMAPHLPEIHAELTKDGRESRLKQAKADVAAALAAEYPERESEIKAFAETVDEMAMRKRVIKDGVRADGRRSTEIRPIWIEADVLPRVHGSAIFTRGQTQALAVTTLGSPKESQMIDDMTGITYKRFMLHYNFPSFSVGEARPPRGPGRREIGHGALAERALAAVVPGPDEFPYTVRLVIEILESNGSSSMATVCSGVLALMDAGVPVKAPVAGIAMGLITDDSGGAVVLSDIQGIEDHLGDMDFKVTGTRKGVTALQMDIKVEGVTRDLLAKALHQAREGREYILSKMEAVLSAPREEMKPQTPRIIIIQIPTEKIREVIGSGGKVIREIVELSGAQVDIEDGGQVYIMASDQAASDRAIAMIRNIVEDVEVGAVVSGPVIRIIEAGAIVQLGPGKDGLIHISELEHRRVNAVTDVLSEGEMVEVKVIEVDKDRGRIRLSRKALLPVPEGHVPQESRGPRPDRGDRGDRGGDRRGGDRDRGGDRGGRPRPPRPPRENSGGHRED
ncbi:MAG: polyribonucleotide nucleotidyltransferase [Candidatus Sumerlaeia bacterium]|nr:polyribonucleotide nucleotidyltransferase [Candidatus Sumerlaeia bacterium]